MTPERDDVMRQLIDEHDELLADLDPASAQAWSIPAEPEGRIQLWFEGQASNWDVVFAVSGDEDLLWARPVPVGDPPLEMPD